MRIALKEHSNIKLSCKLFIHGGSILNIDKTSSVIISTTIIIVNIKLLTSFIHITKIVTSNRELCHIRAYNIKSASILTSLNCTIGKRFTNFINIKFRVITKECVKLIAINVNKFKHIFLSVFVRHHKKLLL